MLDKIFWLVILTLLPGLELRLSIPVGILQNTVHLPFGLVFQGFGMPWYTVFLVCVITNAALGPVIYFLLNKFVLFFLRFQWIERLWQRLVQRTQKRIKPFVERYGKIGIALFIAIPLPGSGSWTGALAAYLLGIEQKHFVFINAAGVLIAGTLVTLASLGVFTLMPV
jgi:uncharacterized membrane protein